MLLICQLYLQIDLIYLLDIDKIYNYTIVKCDKNREL